MIAAAAGCGDPRRPDRVSPLLESDSLDLFDHHVHVMSPPLVERLTAIGARFSKPEYAYSDIDSIMKYNPARRMFLISTAYLYGVLDSTDTDEARHTAGENDFVAGLARLRPERVFAFCSVHPLRDYAVAEARRCRSEQGVYGLKLQLGACGVDLQLPDHRASVEKLLMLASLEGMPVVVHFGDGNGSGEGRQAEIFADSLLPAVPPLDLYIAHFGSSGGYTMETRIALAAFAGDRTGDSGRDGHRFYFDLSAVGLAEPSGDIPALTADDWEELSDRLLEIGLERVVFGSDYPVFNTTAALTALDEHLPVTRGELLRVVNNGLPGETLGAR